MKGKEKSPKPGPSKDEVRAARKVISAHFKARRKSRRRIVRMLHAYRPPSAAMRRFRMFTHDFEVVLEAAVRAGARSPASIVRDAELAAERMGEIVRSKAPKDYDESHGRYRRPRPRRWQDLFDRMVHSMSQNTALTAEKVVKRAESIADLAMGVMDARKPGKPVSKRAA